MIREATVSDAKAICDIYNHYIANTIVSFEEEAVSEDEMARRIEAVLAERPWIVYEQQRRVVGYAYASQWKERFAYRFAAESSVYLDADATRRGIGTALYNELIDRLRTQSCHVVIGGVALPNEASVALHEKLGFEKVAHFKEVGFKMDRWIDVAYWQLFL